VGTVKRTWYEVRRYYGEPIGEPVLKAEKAKVQKRRKPRRPAARIVEPPLEPGEVAPGVRLVTTNDQEGGRGGDNLLRGPNVGSSWTSFPRAARIST
jgi:hypothetical protein